MPSERILTEELIEWLEKSEGALLSVHRGTNDTHLRVVFSRCDDDGNLLTKHESIYFLLRDEEGAPSTRNSSMN